MVNWYRVHTAFRLMSVADALTLSNAVCGVFSILALALTFPDITLATGFILIGMIFDGADGAAARRFGTNHDKGRYLDSLADAITFCLAPGLMVMAVYSKLGPAISTSATAGAALVGYLAILAGLLVIVLGWLRLYWFTTKGYLLKSFNGLATPAMTFLILMLCHLLPPTDLSAFGAILVLALVIAAALMMVTTLEYPKLRGALAVAMTVAILASIGAIALLKWSQWLDSRTIWFIYRALTIGGILILVFYIMVLPFTIALRRWRNQYPVRQPDTALTHHRPDPSRPSNPDLEDRP